MMATIVPKILRIHTVTWSYQHDREYHSRDGSNTEDDIELIAFHFRGRFRP